ncbi:cilia- and flagella-associated protein 90-like [Physella acuta]|uniref:cilia- and flagella-associated protein 90-like n=1 Tax=Physella acuta TaxID=109671 RepID=UPI0027DBBA02|nr:cilia- and flagella-associated protein 90-like [Physella acuta]
MEDERTPAKRYAFNVQDVKHAETKRMNHPTAKMCSLSRWPHTADLTPREIYVMRDSYAGPRRKETCVEYRSNYDRINHPVCGYDQRIHKDNTLHGRTVMCSARDEEKLRTVHIEENMIYGRRSDQFYDFASLMYPRTFLCKSNFLRRNGLLGIPPYKDISTSLPPL